MFPSGKRVRIEINNHRGTVSRSFLNSAFSPGQEFVNLRLCPFGERAIMPGQARREEDGARRREKEMKQKGGLPVGLEHGTGGWRLKGWRRVVARKRGSVIVPLLPLFPCSLTPASIHTRAHTRTRTHAHAAKNPGAHAPRRPSTHRRRRIYARTQRRVFTIAHASENRRVHVSSDAANTHTCNICTQCSCVVSANCFVG